jgi:MFS transporter, UMF1 family
MTWAGLACAFTAPLLGALMDRGGPRKPVMAMFLAAVVICAALLWFVQADGGGLAAWTIPILVIAYATYNWSEVMHNAMLPLAGPRSMLPTISGWGLGLGQLGSCVCLVGLLLVSIFRDQLGVSRELYHLERAVGPFSALWLALFVIPFFVFMPDGAPPGGSWVRAARDTFVGATGEGRSRISAFIDHVRALVREHPRVMHYLVVRIIYADAVTAVLSLGGVYTAGVLGWTISELLLYAIWGSFFGFVGGVFLVGPLERAIGARRAILVELCALVVGVGLAISVSQQSILFGLVPVEGKIHQGELFDTLADVTYLCAIAIVAAAATAIISSSRSMLVAIAPKERISEFFGLYQISSTSTVWLGPLLVGIATNLSGDQRIGFTPVWGMLVVGLLLMLTVRDAPSEQRAPA